MKDLGNQLAYWDGAGAAKTFTHPVNLTWLSGVNRTARILDYGCGYGRVTAELSEHGFSAVSGVDPSPALIERARRLNPDLRFTVLTTPPKLPRDSGSVDVVLLFAVLTCVPDDDAQQALVNEVHRVLAPGGLLYVSDMVLQDDERNRNRYATHADRYNTPYGVFTTDDGAVCRHYDTSELHTLLSAFDCMDEHPLKVNTMNGHQSQALQLLARKR
ncbi:MAG: class I SAM-dependent methyltransferase [Streptomyces sp.]|jgi:SAM-dependent methyltransferase|uniref:class I SAM-dependent methyltransferase n=1 Tax=Streptomyces sp. TaxID=1931 RepID=UPI0025E8ACF1|nr:class I SAM-dependent methyltransferase [Streptomyces sp.]MBW8798054.1 class I SAM-dependent methyltransferase [Streptomyces sp.]